MKQFLNSCERIALRGFGLVLAIILFVSMPVQACTIFVLTDTNRVLYCNNEDWSDPKTRIWFVPGSDKHYGGVYVGFDNDYAQGGVNTEGLAFDWVAGYTETWKPDPNIPIVWGNSGQQALESCATVEEAIAFFRKHQDRGFFRAKILMGTMQPNKPSAPNTAIASRLQARRSWRGVGEPYRSAHLYGYNFS